MSDQETIHVREYQRDDEQGIIVLLNMVFNDWPKIDLPCSKLDHWKWKYLDRPIKKITAYVTEYENKIIACLHGTSVNLKIGKKIYFSKCGGDLAVRPDFRGRGIWRKMVDDWGEKDPTIISYSTSGNPIVVNRAKKYKYVTLPSPVRNYIRVREVDEFLRKTQANIINKIGFRVIRGLAKIRFIDKQHNIENLCISTITEFDERIDDLWEIVKDDYDLIVERKREYLNWRYCDPRGGGYRVRIIEEEGIILGYSVVRINRIIQDFPKGFIIDVVASKDREDVALALFNDACKYFDDSGVNEVQYWVPTDHFFSKFIRRFGFVDTMKEVMVWFSDKGDPSLLDAIKVTDKKRVMFQLGDIDGI